MIPGSPLFLDIEIESKRGALLVPNPQLAHKKLLIRASWTRLCPSTSIPSTDSID